MSDLNKCPVDCGDSSCISAHPKNGMRTNGGCRCFQATHSYQESKEVSLRARKAVMYWKARALEAEKLLKPLKQ